VGLGVFLRFDRSLVLGESFVPKRTGAMIRLVILCV
jgi:hypothetical protein